MVTIKNKNITEFIVREIENKQIVWFKNSNRYVQMEKPAFTVFDKLQMGESFDSIVKFLYSNYELPAIEGKKFIKEIQEILDNEIYNSKTLITKKDHGQKITLPEKFYSEITYHFVNNSFLLKYETAQIEQMIHPLFAHLETTNRQSPNHQIQLFFNNKYLNLVSDNILIGQWKKDDDHFFRGKVFMELLNKAYSKKEDDWMSVLHASAVGNGEKCFLIAGESGSGKSTLSAILMANGFNVIADDFVPIEASSSKVMQFPAAISIKKQAFEMISSMYPELLKAKEFYYEKLNKTVRYLVDNNANKSISSGLDIKAIVFVKYLENSGMQLNKMSKNEAFRRLVPDSWVSPLAENAERFLDWFASIPCFELTYSDNDKVVTSLKSLIYDEL